MPYTARLSRRFYEKFGDEIANELVEWFNAVDATYRSDLKDFNELNFARFDAKVEQRFAESDAKLESRFAAAEVKLEQRFAAAEVKLEQRFAAAEVKLEQRFAAVEVTLERRLSEFERRFAAFEVKLVRLTVTFWTGTILAVAGLALAVLRTR